MILVKSKTAKLEVARGQFSSTQEQDQSKGWPLKRSKLSKEQSSLTSYFNQPAAYFLLSYIGSSWYPSAKALWQVVRSCHAERLQHTKQTRGMTITPYCIVLYVRMYWRYVLQAVIYSICTTARAGTSILRLRLYDWVLTQIHLPVVNTTSGTSGILISEPGQLTWDWTIV